MFYQWRQKHIVAIISNSGLEVELSSILVVSDFEDIFAYDVISFPLEREIKLSIDLTPQT